MSSDLDIRPYQSGDEYSILKLFEQSYGHPLGEKVWTWRFRDNPAGHGVINLVWDGNVLASHYAVTPVYVRISGKDWLTGLSGTTMTHPDYRGRGLFPILARKTYSRMAELGMAMVWGFPNVLSHRGFVRDLGWRDIYEIPKFQLLLDNHVKIPPTQEYIVSLASFDERFDNLWNCVKDDYLIIARRDCAHLQWRYAQNPSERYSILAFVQKENVLGYTVFKRYQEELQVIDILAKEVQVAEELIWQVVRFAHTESVKSVGLWLNVNHPLHHALEKKDFRNAEPVTYFGGLGLSACLDASGLYDYHQWYVTMGDSDVF